MNAADRPAVDRPDVYKRLVELRGAFPACQIAQPVLINSVPKCGTMLLRNIIWMFWPETEWWLPFVEGGDLPEVYLRSQQAPTVFVGHLDYSPVALWHTRLCKKLIVVRHPEQYALSFARFLLSEEFRAISAIAQLVASHELSLREVVRLVLLGTHYQGETIPGIRDQFTHKALAWIDADARLIRYEELLQAASAPRAMQSKRYFEALFAFLGVDLPSDWVARVEAGANRSASTTSPENLHFTVEMDSRSSELGPDEVRLLQVLAPGLTQALGYKARWR